MFANVLSRLAHRAVLPLLVMDNSDAFSSPLTAS